MSENLEYCTRGAPFRVRNQRSHQTPACEYLLVHSRSKLVSFRLEDVAERDVANAQRANFLPVFKNRFGLFLFLTFEGF